MKNWDDIYKLPLYQEDLGSQVYDAERNFVFQFEELSKEEEQALINVLNDDTPLDEPMEVFFNQANGEIFNKNEVLIITIRGWGNLTGIGAHNLSSDDACSIQDTFGQWIVNKLNKNI